MIGMYLYITPCPPEGSCFAATNLLEWRRDLNNNRQNGLPEHAMGVEVDLFMVIVVHVARASCHIRSPT